MLIRCEFAVIVTLTLACNAPRALPAKKSATDHEHLCADGDPVSCRRLKHQQNYGNVESFFILDLGCQRAESKEAARQICEQALLASFPFPHQDMSTAVATKACASGSEDSCAWLASRTRNTQRAPQPRSEPELVTEPVPSMADHHAHRGTGLAVGSAGVGRGFGVGGGDSEPRLRGNVRIGNISVSPSLPERDAQVKIVERSSINRLRTCYTHALDADPSIAGRLTMRLRIRADGAVDQLTASGIESAQLQSCVIAQIRGWTFGPAASAVDVEMPLVLGLE
jgi:hypothetical protein